MAGFESDLLAVHENLAGYRHADSPGALATATDRTRVVLGRLLDVAGQRNDQEGSSA